MSFLRPLTIAPKALPSLWILLVVVLLLLAASIWLFRQFDEHDLSVGPADRGALLMIEDLTHWVSYEPDSSYQRLRKIRQGQATVLTYEYQADTHLQAPYLNYTLHSQPDAARALAVYRPLWLSTQIGLNAGEETLNLEERNDLFRWGDESRFGVIRRNSKPVGNVFVAISGNKVVYCLFTGIFFESGDMFAELMRVPLDRLETWSP